jgi:hypothetical protein
MAMKRPATILAAILILSGHPAFAQMTQEQAAKGDRLGLDAWGRMMGIEPPLPCAPNPGTPVKHCVQKMTPEQQRNFALFGRFNLLENTNRGCGEHPVRLFGHTFLVPGRCNRGGRGGAPFD